MSGLIDYANTDRRFKEEDPVLEQNRDEILKFLCMSGVSYPSEMSRKFAITIEGINMILSYFTKLGFVKHIVPDAEEPQPVFRGRLAELWAEGIYGYKAFNTRSWWTITLAGVEYVKAKYKGHGLRIKGSLLKEYGLEYR